MDRIRIVAAAAMFALIVTASISAARIVGSNGNDTLRGTPQADKLYGKKGNDTIYGLAGNDLIVPGPGRDKVHCGSGRDTVTADAADIVAKDCEVVRRPAPPPPPPPPLALAGVYVGQTTQSEKVSFEVLSGGSSLKDFLINSINLSCSAPIIVSFYGTSEDYGLPKTATIAADGTFVDTVSVDETTPDDVHWKWDVRVTGSFSGQSASGALTVGMNVEVPGFPVPIICNAPNVTWTASRTP
jgi:hypothetical protein